jgi:hypothetical protein
MLSKFLSLGKQQQKQLTHLCTFSGILRPRQRFCQCNTMTKEAAKNTRMGQQREDYH